MWAHYADCHRGLVLGFDANHYFFTDQIGMKSSLLPVEYSDRRHVLPKAEEWTLENTLPTFLRKSIDWSYEEEMRMFARARGAVEVVEPPGLPMIYLFPFPKECLAEIVFGIFTDDAVKDETVQIASDNYPHVSIYQASINEYNFALDIRPFANRKSQR
jgi:hypothetical protein